MAQFMREGCRVLGNYVHGEFVQPLDPIGEWTCLSPADLSDQVSRIRYSYRAIDEAAVSARNAQREWGQRSFEDRATMLKKLTEVMGCRSIEMTRILSREVGKPFWESELEIATLFEFADFLLTRFDPKSIPPSRPLGVLAVIGPYCLPAERPARQFLPALLAGNTVILKPSEKSPITGQLIAECFHDAGFPRGVFNLVQGEREVGRRLSAHDQVDGVLFTGSYEVGARIKQDTLHQQWKFLDLQMGGKNGAIVWVDADLERAVEKTLSAAFHSAGQHCQATSRILVHRSKIEEFLGRFHDRAKTLKIGLPSENPFMGPLIDSSSVDRYLKFLGIAQREGCEWVMRGKALELPVAGHYVTPSICRVKDSSPQSIRKSVYQQTELFAPNVAVLEFGSLEEAIEQANSSAYGMVASIFSADRLVFEKCREELQMGAVYWNRSTRNGSSELSSVGLKKSGNFVPSGVLALRSYMTPQAVLE